MASDRYSIERYVKNKNKVGRHAFFPFIHKEIKQRKFRKKTMSDGSRSKERFPDCKTREIFYANHIDSNIYSYYAEIIQLKYEEKLIQHNLSTCITAYRRIPHATEPRNKCNIDFADEIFSFIKSSNEDALVSITIDIKSFFDNLSHKHLKKMWRYVMDFESSLPKDHYNLFRNITKFSYIHERNIFKKFQNNIIIQRVIDGVSIEKEKKIKRKKYMKEQGAIAYCNIKQIKELREANLIKKNKYSISDNGTLELREQGIPQGSPISAVLANIYLLFFDEEINNLMEKHNGLYRRYSDDIVIICSPELKDQVIDLISKNLNQEPYSLEIQPSKTQIFNFKKDHSLKRFFCTEKDEFTNFTERRNNFQYLGFEFDGKYTLLRSPSLARFHRSMKRSIKRGKFYSRTIRNKTNGELFKRRLYKKCTIKGARRHLIWARDKSNTSKFHRTKRYNWGNYLTYTTLAEKVIKDNKFKSQMKRHWKKFHALLK